MTAPADDLQPHLEPGEIILWQGRPVQGIVARPRDIPMSVFGAFWMLGLQAFYRDAPGGGFPVSLFLFSVPFLFVGLYMLVGHYFHDAASRRHMLYVVTGSRLLVVRRREAASVPLSAVWLVGEGRDTLSFVCQSGHQDKLPDFFIGPEAPRVAEIIRTARARARA